MRSRCLLAVALLLAAAACTRPPPTPGVVAPAPSAREVRVAHGPLVVSVDPCVDPACAGATFGADLARSGILALRITVEAAPDAASHLLSADHIALLEAGASGARLEEVTHDVTTGSRRLRHAATALAIATAVPVVGIAMLPIAAPVYAVGQQRSDDAVWVRHRVALAQLRNHTVSPGGRASGFAFFALGDRLKELEGVVVVVELPALGGEAVERVEVPVSLAADS
jgi:hypothetical protein